MRVLLRTRNLLLAGGILALFAFLVLPNTSLAQTSACQTTADEAYQACLDDNCGAQAEIDRNTCDTNSGLAGLTPDPVELASCYDMADSVLAACNETCAETHAAASIECGLEDTTTTTTTTTTIPTFGEQYNEIRKQGLIFAGICDVPRPSSGADPCECRGTGRCTLENVLQVLVNISVLILGLSGSILLLFLFYGGMLWITAHGNENMISQGKRVITGAITGIVIIFGAYTVINLLIKVLLFGEVTTPTDSIESTLEQEGRVPGATDIIDTQN